MLRWRAPCCWWDAYTASMAFLPRISIHSWDSIRLAQNEYWSSLFENVKIIKTRRPRNYHRKIRSSVNSNAQMWNLSFDKYTTVREDGNIQRSSVKGKKLSVLFFTTFWVNVGLFQNTVFKKPQKKMWPAGFWHLWGPCSCRIESITHIHWALILAQCWDMQIPPPLWQKVKS